MGKKFKESRNSTSTTPHLEVFLTGLPYETTEKQITEFFDFAQEPLVKLPKYQDTGRCLGYGHVVFKTQEEYKKALQKDGQHLGPRYINVRPAKGQKQVEPEVEKKNVPVGCKVIFVKNLPYEISKEAIKEQFSSCGVIKEVRMIRNWQNKKFKGFLYIDFKDNGSVKKAIAKYHGKLFQGRKLVCDAVTTGQKKGFKTFDNHEGKDEDEEQNIEQEEVVGSEQNDEDDE